MTPAGRPARRSAFIATIALTGALFVDCSGSGAAKPSPSKATSSRVAVPRMLRFAGVTPRQDAAVEKIVPAMGGVQNTAYYKSSHSLSVYLDKDVTAKQAAVVRAEVAKLRHKATAEHR